jgi:hypothetical protein
MAPSGEANTKTGEMVDPDQIDSFIATLFPGLQSDPYVEALAMAKPPRPVHRTDS